MGWPYTKPLFSSYAESVMRLLVVVLSLLFMSAAMANEGAKETEEELATKIEYIEMAPKFSVNLLEPKKVLLVNVQLMVEGPAAYKSVKTHMPALRHELIMLYSGRSSDEFQTMEQREALRQETTKVIRETLERMEGPKKPGHGHSEAGKAGHVGGFKDAYFTEFLVD